MDYIENKILKLLEEARRLEIRVAYHQMNWAEWESTTTEDPYPPSYLTDGDQEYTEPFKGIVKSLYISVIYYLDSKGLDKYLSLFYEIFGTKHDEPNFMDDFEIDHYWSREPFSNFLAKMNQFLSVFEFSDTDEGRYKRLSGIQYLETVLRNTASIVSKQDHNISSETQVYNAVKNTLEAIFPSSKSPKSNFIKTAKEYKPDILIPELYVAIEYKYAKDQNKLKTTIEQIAADVKGYTGDKDYTIFYAVFYVTTDFWGIDKFMAVWKEQKFPKNWIPIYAVGK